MLLSNQRCFSVGNEANTYTYHRCMPDNLKQRKQTVSIVAQKRHFYINIYINKIKSFYQYSEFSTILWEFFRSIIWSTSVWHKIKPLGVSQVFLSICEEGIKV